MMKIDEKIKIDIHADDYGVSRHASEDLLELLKEKKLNSISVIPNMSCYRVCMDRLHEEWNNLEEKPLICVHMNLMEGHCLSDVDKVPQLVDSRGYFSCSWGSLLLGSYQKRTRGALQKQIQMELAAQIERVMADLPEGCALRLDSHQHTHMIPVVRDAMLAVMDEKKYPVTFVRDSREPLKPFLQQIPLIPSYGIANMIKNVLLNLYAAPLEKALQKRQIHTSLLWGLNMSGHMDIDRIRKIYPGMQNYFARYEKKIKRELGIEKSQRIANAKTQTPSIEILFHPGVVLPEEINEEYVKKGFVEFHLSEDRKIERHGVECLTQEVIHD